ncbi:MAG: hypothetical protein HQL48_06695 [Gammaproteobacteria bacterium]|nr:hypothetical protein [Gammaproteobacteria bacterium]
MKERESLKQSALEYHRSPRPGKVAIAATKPLQTQNDLALAYSPGVGFPSIEIASRPESAAIYTARSNLVGVISNGTAVLGLGNIGPLASKPVMEGKAVLFKAFAGIDVFDIEINESDPERLIEVIAALEPTFGGINLEDIRAPDCFKVESTLKQRLSIPVFHDDQHGTAAVVAATVLNGLRVVGKSIEEARLVVSGAGAAALACTRQLIKLGVAAENVIVCDGGGVIYEGRTERMNPYKEQFAAETKLRTLQQALEGADIFLGLSVAGILQPQWLTTMAPDPMILALANPVPEIMPELARQVRPDAIISTGRSDYPNQVNNVLCFPYLFRGALDVGATTINGHMVDAAIHAIADLALQQPLPEVEAIYGEQTIGFGRDALLPKPFDPRLVDRVALAVALAAMASGVATTPLQHPDLYAQSLQRLGETLFQQRT